MKLVIALHKGVGDDARSAALIARAARAAGHEVTIFTMSTGVENLADEKFLSLAEAGVQLTVCEHNRKELGAPEGVKNVHYGSQFDLAGYVADADRVIYL